MSMLLLICVLAAPPQGCALTGTLLADDANGAVAMSGDTVAFGSTPGEAHVLVGACS